MLIELDEKFEKGDKFFLLQLYFSTTLSLHFFHYIFPLEIKYESHKREWPWLKGLYTHTSSLDAVLFVLK